MCFDLSVARTERWLWDVAAGLAAGTEPWERGAGGAPGTRSFELIARTSTYEAWVIAWPTGGGLELHDHGGSSGAFCVVSGTLDETVARLGSPQRRHRRHGAGTGAVFDASHIHDIVNVSGALATSVHVYTPHLSTMTFYAPGDDGLLVATRTEIATEPEHPSVALTVSA